jgi:hypothetical protein
MSNYKITDYSKKKAKDLDVEIKPSMNPKKKIDVFKNGKKISSIGAVGYMDYPNYILKDGKEKADKRRELYHKRHKNEGINGKYAKALLW